MLTDGPLENFIQNITGERVLGHFQSDLEFSLRTRAILARSYSYGYFMAHTYIKKTMTSEGARAFVQFL